MLQVNKQETPTENKTSRKKLNTKELAKFYNTWQNKNKQQQQATNENKPKENNKDQQKPKVEKQNRLKQFLAKMDEKKNREKAEENIQQIQQRKQEATTTH